MIANNNRRFKNYTKNVSLELTKPIETMANNALATRNHTFLLSLTFSCSTLPFLSQSALLIPTLRETTITLFRINVTNLQCAKQVELFYRSRNLVLRYFDENFPVLNK